MVVRLGYPSLYFLRGQLPILLENRVQLGRLLRPAALELKMNVLDMFVDDDPPSSDWS